MRSVEIHCSHSQVKQKEAVGGEQGNKQPNSHTATTMLQFLMINMSIIFWLFLEMSVNYEKLPAQFFHVRGDIFKQLVLPNHLCILEISKLQHSKIIIWNKNCSTFLMTEWFRWIKRSDGWSDGFRTWSINDQCVYKLQLDDQICIIGTNQQQWGPCSK